MNRKPFNKRPHFIVNKRVITAAGILIIDYKNNRCLLQYNTLKNRWDDFGGKVEFEDDTILSTMIRELYEESNKLIGNKINQICFKDVQFFYIKKAKYVLAVLDSKNIKIEDDLKQYGLIEEQTNIERYVKWVDCDAILNNKNNLNPRLLHYFHNTCEDITYFCDFFQKERTYFYEKNYYIDKLKQIESDNFVLCQDLSFYKNKCLEYEEEKKQSNILINKFLEMEIDYQKMKKEKKEKEKEEEKISLWKKIFGYI